MNDQSVRQQRYMKVLNLILDYKLTSILEFGCGDGKFLSLLKNTEVVRKIAGIDKNEKKIRRLQKKYPDIELYHSSFLEEHETFYHYDGIIGIEIIEHLYSEELETLIKIIFGKYQPKIIIFTTPNIEYNIHYPVLYDGLRHETHVFEFTPEELYAWGNKIISQYHIYTYMADFCDKSHASQIITFIRGETK